MRQITATEAARNFSEILDAVERRGETFVISRKGQRVAQLSPAPRANGAEVLRVLREHRPDPQFWRDIQSVRELLIDDEPSWTD